MAKQYSPRNFLRLAPNALLERYFRDRGLLTDLDIASLPETKIDTVFEAWMALPSKQTAEVDSDFALVDLLADEQGIQAILDEAGFHDLGLVSAFEELPGFQDKALLAFLEHRGIVEVAARFREADRLPNSYWVRRREGVPAGDPRDDEETCAELAHALASYFRLKEGRGRECQVDVYRRGEHFYYFGFPEDYGRAELEYIEGKLERRAQRPVFHVVFVFDPQQRTLDTFFRGAKKTRLELETIFGRVILGAELAPAKDERVYDLNAFKKRDVKFVYDPASGIQDVRVKLLRLSLIGGGARRLTMEADPQEGRGAVYDLLDAAFRDAGNGVGISLPLGLTNVTRVGIEVLFSRDGRRGRPTKTFYLTYPNGCTLKHDGRDAALRRMLIDSKIEPSVTAAPASTQG